MAISLVSTGIPDLLPMRSRSHDIPHLSEIIRYIAISNGHYALNSSNSSSSTSDPDIDPTVMTRMQLGQALEFSLMQRYALHSPHRFVTTGEIRCGGIALTPDVMDILIPSIDDFKLTWMSSNVDPTDLKFWKWWTQVMCYAYAVGQHFRIAIDTVKLHVCHVNGSGKGASPVMNEWRMDCEKGEIEGRWDLIYSTSKTRAFLDWLREQKEREAELVKRRLREHITGPDGMDLNRFNEDMNRR
jgi:hypothetical protein